MQAALKKDVLRIGNTEILPGERKRVRVAVAALYDFTELTIPVEVIRGKSMGPTMFISAAIHGDEINGVEIIKQLLQKPILSKLKGTLLVVPVVNIFGFNNKSRYLPDRRDLNRCFPGNAKGSLGAQLAHVFMKEIVSKCSHGIDLHTGAIHRVNLPQIRACLDDSHTEELAKCFGVPVIIDSKLRDGSLREAARKKKVTTLLFEGGQALRFEDKVIRQGVSGCTAVMRKIGMLPSTPASLLKPLKQVYVAKSSYWIRAPHSGSFRTVKNIGDHIQAGELLAIVSDPFGNQPFEVYSEVGGIIIGISAIPLVNTGDAMIYIATFSNSKRVKCAIEEND